MVPRSVRLIQRAWRRRRLARNLRHFADGVVDHRNIVVDPPLVPVSRYGGEPTDEIVRGRHIIAVRPATLRELGETEYFRRIARVPNYMYRRVITPARRARDLASGAEMVRWLRDPVNQRRFWGS